MNWLRRAWHWLGDAVEGGHRGQRDGYYLDPAETLESYEKLDQPRHRKPPPAPKSSGHRWHN